MVRFESQMGGLPIRLTCTSRLKETRGRREVSDLCESVLVTSGILTHYSSCKTSFRSFLVSHTNKNFDDSSLTGLEQR